MGEGRGAGCAWVVGAGVVILALVLAPGQVFYLVGSFLKIVLYFGLVIGILGGIILAVLFALSKIWGSQMRSPARRVTGAMGEATDKLVARFERAAPPSRWADQSRWSDSWLDETASFGSPGDGLNAAAGKFGAEAVEAGIIGERKTRDALLEWRDTHSHVLESGVLFAPQIVNGLVFQAPRMRISITRSCGETVSHWWTRSCGPAREFAGLAPERVF